MIPRSWVEENVPRLQKVWSGDVWKVALELIKTKGVDFFIIMADHGVGVIKKRPVVIETKEGDTIGIKSMMVLSLGFDHRLIDGAGGSQFVDTVRENLENMNLEALL